MTLPFGLSRIDIRSSATSNYPDCQRRGAARTFRSIIEQVGFVLNSPATGIAAPIGTATHAGWAHEMVARTKGEPLPPFEQSRDCAINALDEAIEEDTADTGRPVMFDNNTAPNLNAAQRQVTRMLHVVHEQLSPLIDPIAVEDFLEADIGDGFYVTGHRDSYAKVFTQTGSGLTDLKTSAHKSKHMPQLGNYSLLGATNGERSDWIQIAWLPRVSLHKTQPDIDFIPVDPTEAECAAAAVNESMKSGLLRFMETQDPHVFLTNPSSSMCSAKWCPAWGTEFCKEHTT